MSFWVDLDNETHMGGSAFLTVFKASYMETLESNSNAIKNRFEQLSRKKI